MQSFRLKSPIVATEHLSTGLLIIQIDAGEVLRIADMAKASGSVEATFHDRSVTVYLQDLRAGGERVEAEAR